MLQPVPMTSDEESASEASESTCGGLLSDASPTLNALPVYNRANVPVFWGELSRASHFEPVGNAGDYRGPSTAWFRYHLMDDASAEDTFYGSNCDLCSDRDWDVRRKGIN